MTGVINNDDCRIADIFQCQASGYNHKQSSPFWLDVKIDRRLNNTGCNSGKVSCAICGTRFGTLPPDGIERLRKRVLQFFSGENFVCGKYFQPTVSFIYYKCVDFYQVSGGGPVGNDAKRCYFCERKVIRIFFKIDQ